MSITFASCSTRFFKAQVCLDVKFARRTVSSIDQSASLMGPPGRSGDVALVVQNLKDPQKVEIDVHHDIPVLGRLSAETGSVRTAARGRHSISRIAKGSSKAFQSMALISLSPSAPA